MDPSFLSVLQNGTFKCRQGKRVFVRKKETLINSITKVTSLISPVISCHNSLQVIDTSCVQVLDVCQFQLHKRREALGLANMKEMVCTYSWLFC